MSLLVNKTKYKKYIEKTDPAAHTEKEEYLQKLNNHKRAILSMTNRLVENPDDPITNEVNDLFCAYTKEVIRYLQDKKKNDDYVYKEDHVEEDEILFEKIENSAPSSSFWSRDQVIKANAILQTIPKAKLP